MAARDERCAGSLGAYRGGRHRPHAASVCNGFGLARAQDRAAYTRRTAYVHGCAFARATCCTEPNSFVRAAGFSRAGSLPAPRWLVAYGRSCAAADASAAANAFSDVVRHGCVDQLSFRERRARVQRKHGNVHVHNRGDGRHCVQRRRYLLLVLDGHVDGRAPMRERVRLLAMPYERGYQDNRMRGDERQLLMQSRRARGGRREVHRDPQFLVLRPSARQRLRHCNPIRSRLLFRAGVRRVLPPVMRDLSPTNPNARSWNHQRLSLGTESFILRSTRETVPTGYCPAWPELRHSEDGPTTSEAHSCASP